MCVRACVSYRQAGGSVLQAQTQVLVAGLPRGHSRLAPGAIRLLGHLLEQAGGDGMVSKKRAVACGPRLCLFPSLLPPTILSVYTLQSMEGQSS